MLPDAANMVDSPELGPPPIAHFEDGDSTKLDTSGEDVNSANKNISEDDMQPKMFANLETRKRRRESTNLREKISLGMESENLGNSVIAEQPTVIRKSFKSGAKRKLDVAVDEDLVAVNDSVDESVELGKGHVDSAVNKSLRPGPLRGENPVSEKCLQEPGTELSNASMSEASAAIIKNRKALGPSKSKNVY